MEGERNKQIDGLKGIAAIMVLIFHLFCRYLQIYEESNIWWLSQLGNFGVVIFLLISGYFLGRESSNDETVKKFRFIDFIKNKIIRLWPSYMISITIIMIVVKLAGLPGRECNWLDYGLNIFFINGFLGMPYVDGAHWYLTTLISITIFIGLIRKVKLNNNPYIFYIWLVCVGILIKLGYGGIAGLAGGEYLGVAIVGVMLSKVLKKENKKIDIKWFSVLVTAILFCLFIQGTVGVVVLLLGLLVVILCLIKKIKIFENKVFSWLGKISYSLYLIHQNIGFVIIRYLSMIGGHYKIAYSIIAMISVFILAITIFYAENMVRKRIVQLIQKKKSIVGGIV